MGLACLVKSLNNFFQITSKYFYIVKTSFGILNFSSNQYYKYNSFNKFTIAKIAPNLYINTART